MVEEALGQSFRRIEIASIVIFATLVAVLCSKIAPLAGEHPFLVVAAVFAGYVGADFASGFVHWMGDTWGTCKTPGGSPVASTTPCRASGLLSRTVPTPASTLTSVALSPPPS